MSAFRNTPFVANQYQRYNTSLFLYRKLSTSFFKKIPLGDFGITPASSEGGVLAMLESPPNPLRNGTMFLRLLLLFPIQ